MPSVFGKESKKKELIANLGNIFADLQRQHQISAGDFPNLERMQVRDDLYGFCLLADCRFPFWAVRLVRTRLVQRKRNLSFVVTNQLYTNNL